MTIRFRFLNSIVVFSTRRIQFCSGRFSKNTVDPADQIYADIQKRVSTYKRELKKHVQASLRHRQLKARIGNLNEAMAAMESRRNENSAPEPIPNRISLEVLSSGTGNMEPAVLLKTPIRGYLFNCPESTSRMLPSLLLRANNINDILVTSCNIRRIGGVSGFMLSQSQGVAPTRIHGPPFIRNYLEFLRPFADAEFGEVKYPGTVVQQPYDSGPFKDVTFVINYIPLHDLTLEKGTVATCRADRLSIAYLVETNPAQKKIDVLKIMELKIPKGPLIGQLKSGKSITLEDGRVINPEDVYADDHEGMQNSSVLVVDVTTESQLQSLLTATILQPYLNGTKNLDYLVHFTQSSIFDSQSYQSFSSMFDDRTTQLVCNGTGSPDPHLESVYRAQIGHSAICEKFFPILWPKFEGIIKEDSEFLRDSKGRILARPMQRFVLRGPKMGRLEECAVDLRPETNVNLQKVINDKIKEKFEEEIATLPAVDPEPFPKIIFLGTSSAVPSKYRNVTSIMLQTESSFYMVDCGEGTYGQMKHVFGEEINEVLRKLNVVFFTHTHQDHTNGLVTLLQERDRACQMVEVEKRPKKLVVVCNRNILKHMHTFSQRFYDIFGLAKFVVPIIYVEKKLVPADLTKIFEQMELSECMQDLEAKAVKVNHTSDAVGYILTTKEKNRKIVFSGDTTPCDFLIEHGKNAHVLIHEGTFEDGYEDDALHKKHSTMLQAVNVGKAMKAKHIILTHFSARYPKVPALPDYLDKNEVSIAMDNLVISMEDLHKLPKMNNAYRMLYDEELFEILKKNQQRGLRTSGPPPAKKMALNHENS